MKNCFYVKLFFKTHHHQHLKLDESLTDATSASIHTFISVIPSQMHPSPVTLWQVILIFMLVFLLLIQEIKTWLIHYSYETRLVFQSCLIHTDLQDVLHFDSLIFNHSFLCNFLLVFWLATLAFISPAIYRGDLLLHFQIKYSSFLQKFCLLVSVQLILSVVHIQYLITVQFLVATLKIFLLFFSLILNLISVLKPSFSIHISVSFSFCLFAPEFIRILSSTFPSLETLFILF